MKPEFGDTEKVQRERFDDNQGRTKYNNNTKTLS